LRKNHQTRTTTITTSTETVNPSIANNFLLRKSVMLLGIVHPFSARSHTKRSTTRAPMIPAQYMIGAVPVASPDPPDACCDGGAGEAGPVICGLLG
jgi:hypothetical protein